MKYFSYLNTAAHIIGLYKGLQPFQLFIKDFFRQHKKYGSSDRKQITHLCYCYFRLGKSWQDLPVTEKIPAALFLCSTEASALLLQLQPAWNEAVSASPQKKCGLINIPYDLLQIFPCANEVSSGININDFILSHLVQPDIFLRIRPGYKKAVEAKLEQAKIAYSISNGDCIRIPNITKVDSLIDVDKEAVIQDYNSQRTGDCMKRVTAVPPVKIWDCCAASGGKSILAKDIFKKIDLTVSDIRKLVLDKLVKRFEAAGLHHYKTLVADLSKPLLSPAAALFDFIMADVPCTGSGTWGRTPERLSFFNEQEIDTYSRLQQRIVTTVFPYLKKEGFFLYMTCSVFKKENEDMVDFIQHRFPVDLLHMETLKGYGLKADSMFAALFKLR